MDRGFGSEKDTDENSWFLLCFLPCGSSLSPMYCIPQGRSFMTAVVVSGTFVSYTLLHLPLCSEVQDSQHLVTAHPVRG